MTKGKYVGKGIVDENYGGVLPPRPVPYIIKLRSGDLEKNKLEIESNENESEFTPLDTLIKTIGIDEVRGNSNFNDDLELALIQGIYTQADVDAAQREYEKDVDGADAITYLKYKFENNKFKNNVMRWKKNEK